MSDCVRCTAPAGNLNLCSTCTLALRIDLGDVPALLGDLDITRCRLDHITQASTRRGAEQPLPYKPQASEAVYVLHSTLAAWVLTLNPRNTLTGTAALAQWLYTHTDLIRGHVDAEQAHDELTYAIREARRVIDRPNDQRQFLGRCGNAGCCEELYGRPHQPTATCPTCNAEWDVARRRAWMLDRVEDEVETAPVLAALLTQLDVHITVDTIQRFAKQGRLPWVSMDAHRRRRYRVRDVLDLFLGATRQAS